MQDLVNEESRARMGRLLSRSDERRSVEVFLECASDWSWTSGSEPGYQSRRGHGFGLRRSGGGEDLRQASGDGVEGPVVARALARIGIDVRQWESDHQNWVFIEEALVPVDGGELGEELFEAIRLRYAEPFELRIGRHRRRSQVLRSTHGGAAQFEEFGSWEALAGSGLAGGLFCHRDGLEEEIAAQLRSRLRALTAAPPPAGPTTVVLAAPAAAVLLHESVAHLLEADLLARCQQQRPLVGRTIGTPVLDVLDAPSNLPEGLSRDLDDEAIPALRRWLLRNGRVEQPISDLHWAQRGSDLLPGAGWRADRHSPVLPRTSHLELLPSEGSLRDLVADVASGLLLEEVDRGGLDPDQGSFWLEAPWSWSIRQGKLSKRHSRCRLEGDVLEILGSVVQVGGEERFCGAGWCAKGGQRRAVWATCPALTLATVEVMPI